ncbi:MAG TPA: FtsX-like permease family protein [Phycisphaerae bacterium]|nr:FtsX-like permease family protein [Phycisphaerae bacterium]HRW53079.1 FtsX-like permease family protein [Phycisphaerae bacterium]
MKSLIFTLLAPITVPLYVLFLALANLFGGAYYIVVEASLAKILRRPVSLSHKQLWIYSIPVICAAPIALAAHLLIAAAKAFIAFLRFVGRWQADVQGKWTAVIPGLAWTLVAFWVTLTCLNAAVGVRLIGQGIPQENIDRLVEFSTRSRTLGVMPPPMQARRRQLIQAFENYDARATEEEKASFEYLIWKRETEALQDDDSFTLFLIDRRATELSGMPALLPMQQLSDVPWFYFPKEFSNDGLDRSVLLLGPLFFAWLLLYRWPGMFAVLPHKSMRISVFVVRLAVVAWAIHWLVTWDPMTPNATFLFFAPNAADGVFPEWFRLISPLLWFHASPEGWARPEWILLNTGLLFAMFAVATFIWWLGWRLSAYLAPPRYYVAFLASRLLQRKRIAFFSVGAVTLCVAMMIIVKSVMGGFVDSIREKANGLLGHLVVAGSMQGFPYYEEFLKDLHELKDPRTNERIVEAATPIIHTYGVVQFPHSNETLAVAIRGIRLDEYMKVNDFGRGLFYNTRFGDVSLATPRGRPVYGLGPEGRVALPGDMDEYFYKTYLPSLPEAERADIEKRYARPIGDTKYPGPGSFLSSDRNDFAPEFAGKAFPGIILGSDLTLQRLPSGDYNRDAGYALGEEAYVTMLALTRGGDTMDEPPPKVLFRYVDDSRTGIHEVDSKNVYIDFDIAQKLLQMGPAERTDGTTASPRCFQILIRLRDRYVASDAELARAQRMVDDAWQSLRQRVESDEIEYRLMRHVDTQTYEQMQASFISAIKKEEVLVMIMFGVISLVAIFLILCIFYMIVQEKTRDMGIIKSVGGSTEGIAAVFLVYAAAIGLVGCLLGSVLGTTFVTYINDVQDFLARISPELRIWNPETYSFDQIPNKWKAMEVFWICVLAIVASVLGATIPAIKAGRTWPVESLRYE